MSAAGATALVLPHLEAGQLKKATKDGWWVKIDTQHTEAKSVKFSIGLGGSDESHEEWSTWNSSDPAEFDVPEAFRTVREIWIKGEAIPEDKNVALCVYYRDRATQKMKFDDEEEHEISQGDDDEC